MSNRPSLSKTLSAQNKRENKSKLKQPNDPLKERIEKLQLELLRIQQGVWHRKARVIVVFEGFDASGKGGCIRELTERLDPRGVRVHPIGPPEEIEQKTHWMYRFWTRLPAPGTIAIFDRSWYGRVLVERVEGLIPQEAWKRAYREINEFERMLADDGVELIKFFLAVSSEEQLHRFQERLENPHKRWKLTLADIQARKHWKHYVQATDELLKRTHQAYAQWKVVGSDDKSLAHFEVMTETVKRFAGHRAWIEKESRKDHASRREIKKALKKMRKA